MPPREASVDRATRLESSFRALVDGAPNAMVVVDAQGVIILFNTQAERLFDYPRADIMGQPLETLVPHRFRAAHPDLRRGFTGAPGARPMGAGRDLYALRRDGGEIPVEIGLTPVETPDGLMVLAAIIDISERQHREERLRRALTEKEILLGEIHHRVKNNLQIVESLLEMQKGRLSDPVAAAALQESQNRVKSMAVIHQTLYQSADFSRVDLDTVLRGLADNLFLSYGAVPRIRLNATMDPVHLPIDQAIPLGLVFNELISNALKHAFPNERLGEIRVELRYGAGNVLLAISDDGIGLPQDLAVDGGSLTTLGLQMVPLLVRQIAGTLTVERGPPTRFAIIFPAGGAGPAGAPGATREGYQNPRRIGLADEHG